MERFREIWETMSMACTHGYPVRIFVAGVSYDGWVWGSETPSSVTVCYGKQRYTFEWSEIESASFYTPLSERLTGAWLVENL